MYAVRTILTVILTLYFLDISWAQIRKGFCGYKAPSKSDVRSMGIPGYFGCNVINKVNRTLQVSLHISLDSLGERNISEASIEGGLQQVNIDFAPCGLQFQYCFREDMPNDRFDSLSVFSYYNEEVQMRSIHFEPNTINLYLVDTIGIDALPDVAGYAGDIIVIEKSAFAFGSHVGTHEFGHFFGLHHTFETDYGVELADGSNCETTGDLVCDTEADPDPEGTLSQVIPCNYAGSVTQDANGDWYLPPTDNFMSYYDCACRFTVQQYNRIVANYLGYLFFLW